jgi:putative FmdB family regulatory protein
VPIYEYRRPDGTTFEVMQSMSEDTLTHDPETGVPVVKVLHAPSIHFKGSGFYNTDYGKQKNRASKSEGEGSSSDSGKSDSGSSDSGSSSSSDSGSSSSGDGSKSKDGGAKAAAKSDSSSS